MYVILKGVEYDDIIARFRVRFCGTWRWSSVNFETFLPEIYVWKINKMLEFYVIFTRKNYQNARIFLWYLPEKLT